MKRFGIVTLVSGVLFGLALQCEAQPWHIGYGKEKGCVSVFNSKTNAKFAEDAPYGPMSFRVQKNQLWLLDSIGGKLYSFNEKNELKTELLIAGLPENVLLEDFALVNGSSGNPEAVWIADASDCSIRKISLGNSKELLRIGGNGSEPGKFLQISQLEVDRGGRLYVGDYGRKVVAVFTQYGELVREIPWENCGFAVDLKGNLHLLTYREKAGYFHRIYSQQGQLESSRHVGLQDLQNARVWSVSEEGSLIVSFVPAGGYKGKLKLYEIMADAKLLNKAEFAPPGAMNRYIGWSGQQLWLAKADFMAAPDGKFVINSLNWDGKK